jgi:hypothetical protein
MQLLRPLIQGTVECNQQTVAGNANGNLVSETVRPQPICSQNIVSHVQRAVMTHPGARREDLSITLAAVC